MAVNNVMTYTIWYYLGELLNFFTARYLKLSPANSLATTFTTSLKEINESQIPTSVNRGLHYGEEGGDIYQSLDGVLTLTDVHARILKHEEQIFTDCNVDDLQGLSNDSFGESSAPQKFGEMDLSSDGTKVASRKKVVHMAQKSFGKPSSRTRLEPLREILMEQRNPASFSSKEKYLVKKHKHYVARFERIYGPVSVVLGWPSKEQQASDGIGQKEDGVIAAEAPWASCGAAGKGNLQLLLLRVLKRGLLGEQDLEMARTPSYRDPTNLRLASLMSLDRRQLKELDMAAVIDQSDPYGKRAGSWTRSLHEALTDPTCIV
ncbi:hypothetical protein FF38_07161 [Lucilia cuprina]|uniref:Uncharacterized protein n=1 Tax=Lucilia cuprina TaxID=7375 RepID=A0A0L0CL70_LUCCU|nr:hypothetical protein FF38_07161 [Lucilia cuprina]